MKKFACAIATMILLLPITACPQHPVTPPHSACQPAGGYIDLNPSGTASTSFTVSSVSTPTCYQAQGMLPAANGVPVQYGAASNIVGPSVGGATGESDLGPTFVQPTAGQTVKYGTTYTSVSGGSYNFSCTGFKYQ